MSQLPEDPIVTQGRREFVLVLAVWIGALVYTVGYCGLRGYGRTADDLTFVLGVPDWAMWGVIAPWTVCLVICWVFAYWIMSDAELGADSDDDLGDFDDA